jgi:hypothetical protein
MNPQTLLTLSKVILLVGTIFVAFGAFGSYIFSKKIKNTPPVLFVESIVPVMIYQKREFFFKPEEKIPLMDKGISFVARVKSPVTPITVNRLKIKGKIFISPNRYIAQDIHAGRNIKELYQEWESRKPYILVNWMAYIDEKKSSSELNAFDDKLICFTLIDPIVNGQPESGWTVPFSDYLGYSDGTKTPIKERTYPEFNFIFKTEIGKEFPFDIRDEIKSGDLEFFIVAASKDIPISYEKFGKTRLFGKKYWDKNPAEKIIFRDQ